MSPKGNVTSSSALARAGVVAAERALALNYRGTLPRHKDDFWPRSAARRDSWSPAFPEAGPHPG